MTNTTTHVSFGESPVWSPTRPRLRPLSMLVGWLVSALALLAAAAVVPHVDIPSFRGAIVTAAIVAVLNAVLPPIVAALRLPFMLLFGFLLVLVLDAAMLLIASSIDDRAIQVDSFWWALLTGG